MCGIGGFNWEDKRLAKEMVKRLSHRGPDQSGTFCDKHVSLAHTRLSIIDLSERGKQPMFNRDGTITIVYNGEIYNFKEIREELEKKGYKFNSESDTEVIIYSFEEYGEECFDMFDGIFAFVIYDIKKKGLYLVRDHIGVKPLYYYIKDNKLIFASEIKAILLHELGRKVNWESFNKYLNFRYVPGKETMFLGIKKLRPGTFLRYNLKTNEYETKRYWSLKLNPENKGEKYYTERLYNLLKKTVEMQLISDVPLGVFSSGGVDSSAVVAFMSKIGVEKIKTFSIGFNQYNDRYKELETARFVADCFGTDHHEIRIDPDSINLLPKVIWHLDEPVSDATTIPTYLLAKFAKKHVTVTLTGEGGDEAFGGYVQYKTLFMNELFVKPIPKPIRSNLISPMVKKIPVDLLTKFFQYPSSIGKEGRERLSEFLKHSEDKTKTYLNLISVFTEEEKTKYLNSKAVNKFKKYDIVEETRNDYFKNKGDYQDQVFLRENETWLPDYILNRLDKMTMAFAIESRVPLLDINVVNFAATIPRRFKDDKYIFRKSMTRLLPKKIRKRKKHPFYIPIDAWFNKGIKEMCYNELLDKDSVTLSLFRRGFIENLLRKSSSSLLHSRQLWLMLTFELWHKIYIEEDIKRIKLTI